MAQQDPPGRQPLQLGHADVIGIEDLDQIVAQHAHGIDGHDGRKRHGRQGHGPDVFGEIGALIDQRHRRQHGHHDHEADEQHGAEQEVRHREQHQGDDGEAVVEHPVATHRLDQSRNHGQR